MYRYLIFAYKTYYPSGGMQDFIIDVDCLSELKEVLLENLDNDLFEVYDSLRNEYVIQETYIKQYIKNLN